ncbi:MAG: aminotransferase class I and II, partial [Blastocatellia bacterium]|nr:aminotransferase class I and II [Blastocatellia bacterium]
RWDNHLERSRDPFPLIRNHVLLPFAGALTEADSKMTGLITPELIDRIIEMIPDAWLADDPSFSGISRRRNDYKDYLLSRRSASRVFLEEAIHARSLHI